jgi:hypothetical protein
VVEVGRPRGSSQGTSPNDPEDFRAQAVKAYTESGLFSSVVTTGDPSDLRADIAIIEKGSDGLAWSGIISALTFTIIPGYVSQGLITNTSYKDRQEKVIGIIEKNEALGYWIQFFLLFAMPFVDGPGTLMNASQFDLHRATIDEAHRKGFF